MRKFLHGVSFVSAAFLAISLTSNAGAAGSASDAKKVIDKCMAGKNAGNARQCIGQYSGTCVQKAGAGDGDYFTQANCLADEATAWRNFRDGAVASFLADNGTTFATSVAAAAQASDKFAVTKCAIFQDTAMFGQSGMSLEAQCLLDEAARMAIFIGRELD